MRMCEYTQHRERGSEASNHSFRYTCMKAPLLFKEAKKREGGIRWCIEFEMAAQINCLGLQRILALVPGPGSPENLAVPPGIVK